MKQLLVNVQTGEQQLVDLTAEEQAVVDKRFSDEATLAAQRKIEEDNIATNKTSGKAKLKSGDALTDAEVSALFGDN